MKDDNLVTIYIPTFNRISLLKRAIESVQNQTYSNVEIIIVDDCSTDGTHDYLKEVVNQDSRVKYFLKEKNSGAPISRNIAIQNATGTYITGLDDDDYFAEDRIENFLNHANLLEKYEFLYSGYLFEKDNIITQNKANRFKQPKNLVFKDLVLTNYVGNQIFTLTARLKSCEGFDVNLKAWQDLELWLRLLQGKNKRAKYLNDETYVVNKNFDMSRITLRNKGEKIKQSYEFIANKLKLESDARKVLSMQMNIYGVSIPMSYIFYAISYAGLSAGLIYYFLFLLKLKIKG